MQRVEMRFGDRSGEYRKVRVRGAVHKDGDPLYLLSSRKALHVAHAFMMREEPLETRSPRQGSQAAGNGTGPRISSSDGGALPSS